MDTYSAPVDLNFLVRRGTIYGPSEPLPHPSMSLHRRVVEPLLDEELDNLVRDAFACNDAEDTFRGRLRQAVENVKPDVLTSICAYRIGFEFNATELTLLVTVLPGSLTQSQSVELLSELTKVLEDYDERLGALAIEVAEQAILLAGGGQPVFETSGSHGKKPAEAAKPMSTFGSSPSPGSNVGLADAHLNVGTLGVFLHGLTGDMIIQCLFGLTCNHVLSPSETPTDPGRGASDVFSLANSARAVNWGLTTDNTIKLRNTAFAQTQEGQGAFQPTTSIGTMYASSGLRVSWELLRNIPSQFEHDMSENNRTEAVFAKMDGYPSGKVAAIPRSSRVFKVGCMTSHTAGRMHDIDPSVTIRYPVYGPCGCKHYVAIKGRTLAIHPGYNGFAGLGDGGALVLNGRVEVVGIVTAVAKGSAADGVVYVSPLGPILRDIKQMLQRQSGQKLDVEVM